jgi:hypothetical protein
MEKAFTCQVRPVDAGAEDVVGESCLRIEHRATAVHGARLCAKEKNQYRGQLDSVDLSREGRWWHEIQMQDARLSCAPQ